MVLRIIPELLVTDKSGMERGQIVYGYFLLEGHTALVQEKYPVRECPALCALPLAASIWQHSLLSHNLERKRSLSRIIGCNRFCCGAS